MLINFESSRHWLLEDSDDPESCYKTCLDDFEEVLLLPCKCVGCFFLFELGNTTITFIFFIDRGRGLFFCLGKQFFIFSIVYL
jgi:hypothetical protein